MDFAYVSSSFLVQVFYSPPYNVAESKKLGLKIHIKNGIRINEEEHNYLNYTS